MKSSLKNPFFGKPEENIAVYSHCNNFMKGKCRVGLKGYSIMTFLYALKLSHLVQVHKIIYTIGNDGVLYLRCRLFACISEGSDGD